MRAALIRAFGEPTEVLELADVPEPSAPAAGEVLAEVEAARAVGGGAVAVPDLAQRRATISPSQLSQCQPSLPRASSAELPHAYGCRRR